MTLANYLKQFDLTIKDVCAFTGRSRQTVYNWYNQDKEFFIVVLLGVQSIKDSNFRIVLDFEVPY